MEECLASQIQKYKFRDREKRKEIGEKDFNTSTFETTLERIERL